MALTQCEWVVSASGLKNPTNSFAASALETGGNEEEEAATKSPDARRRRCISENAALWARRAFLVLVSFATRGVTRVVLVVVVVTPNRV